MQAYLGEVSAPQGPGKEGWEAYPAKDHNFAVQAGLSPIQNWVYAPYVFSSLDPMLTPRMAVGLALDWADLPGLLRDLVVESRVPQEERQAAIREMRAKLDGWVADGSVSHPILGYWSLLMAAFEAERLRDARHAYVLPYLYEWLGCDDLLEGLPLLHDALALCGCAVVCDWAFRGDRATPPKVATLIEGFLSFLAERVEALGRAACQPEGSLAAQGPQTANAAAAVAAAMAAGLGAGEGSTICDNAAGTAASGTASEQHGGRANGGASTCALASPAGSAGALATTPAIPGDSSTVPGIRAAALAYAVYAVACDLARSNFPWVSVWRRQLDATSKLAGIFGAPPGRELASWQIVALKLLKPPLELPKTDKSLGFVVPERGTVSSIQVMKEVAGPAVMEGCIRMVTQLTGPYEVLLQHEAQVPELSTFSPLRVVPEHLAKSVSGVLKCLQHHHLAEEFLKAGGIHAMLGFLSRYAALQRGLTWRHPAHSIAADCAEVLNMLPFQSLPHPETKSLQSGRQVFVQEMTKAGVSRVFLAVLRDFPSMAHVAKYVSQDKLDNPLRESPHVRMLLSMLAVLRVVCKLSVHAKRQLALELDGLKLVVHKGTHWEPGVPLGTEGGKRLAEQTPGAGRMFRLWAQLPLGLIAEILEGPEAEDNGGILGEAGETWPSEVLGRLRQLMSPAELLGMLRWRDSEAKDGVNFPVEGLCTRHVLECSVLSIANKMAVKMPGISKVLAAEQHFVAYLLEECRKPFQTPDDPIDSLLRRAWAATLLQDMVWHLQRGPQGRSPASGATNRQLIRAMMEGNALHAALYLLRGALAGAWDLDKYLEERLGLLRGNARREVRREQAMFEEKGLYWYWRPAAAANKLIDTVLGQDPSLVRRACREFVASRDSSVLGPPFHRLCASMQRSRDKDLRATAAAAAAALRRVEALAKEAEQAVADTEAAAREAAAAALLAEEEAAQRAQQTKAAKRQRQKAAKQAQQAQEQADREEKDRRQRAEQEQQQRQQAEQQKRREAEERQQREAEELLRRQTEERQQEEAAQRQGAQEPAAADAPTSSAAGQSTKSSKRQRKKVAQQAQHAPDAKQATASADVPRGQGPAGTDDACAAPAVPSQQPPTGVPTEGLAALPEEQQTALQPSGVELREAAAAASTAAGEQDPELQELLSMLFPAMQLVSPAEPQLADGVGRPPQQPASHTGEAKNRITNTSASASSSSSSSNAACTVWVDTPDSSAMQLPPTKPPPARLAHPPSLAAVIQCRLSGQPLQDPVVAADGWTYERSALEAYLAGGGDTSPVTGQPLGSTLLRPNFAVRDLLAAGGPNM